MSRSTEVTSAAGEFVADVLRTLLTRIDSGNREGGRQFLVSHAWSNGAYIYLVYTAPPSNITWGLTRDTRQSIVDGGPWESASEAALYYYLLDLEENWPGNFSRERGEPDTIRWAGDTDTETNVRSWSTVAEIPPDYRLEASISTAGQQDKANRAEVEPRRYVDPD